MQQNVIGLYSGRNHCVSVIGVIIVIMGEEGGRGYNRRDTPAGLASWNEDHE